MDSFLISYFPLILLCFYLWDMKSTALIHLHWHTALSLSTMKLKCYSRSTAATFWAFPARLPAFCFPFLWPSKLVCAQKKMRRMEIKRKPSSWSFEGLERTFPTLLVATVAIAPLTSSHEESLCLDNTWSECISQHKLQIYSTIFFQY